MRYASGENVKPGDIIRRNGPDFFPTLNRTNFMHDGGIYTVDRLRVNCLSDLYVIGSELSWSCQFFTLISRADDTK